MRTASLPALMLAALLPLSASAIPITYEFSGVAYNGNGEGPPDGMTYTPIVTELTPFSGSFTIENGTPETFQDTGYLRYDNSIVAASLTLGVNGSLGTFGLSSGPSSPYASYSSSISFINDKEFAGNPPYDQFNLNFSLDPLLPGAPPGSYSGFYLYFGDYTALSLPSGLTLADPLPVDSILANPNLTPGFGYVKYDDNGQYLTSANVFVRDFTLQQVAVEVPEPGTFALMGIGLLGLLLTRRRRHCERARFFVAA